MTSPWQPKRRERTRYQRANDAQEYFSENSEDGPRPSLGKPEKKRRIYPLGLASAATSLVCLALSILAVANNSISWHLGVENRQLIVIGFLLSIMNLCLSNVGPRLFLLLEARFGESTLQNYDALLRNSLTAPKISLIWRVVLSSMLALPLGLSVAYKTFTGGESSLGIRSADFTPTAPFYGLFPNQLGIASFTGISQFLNATASFRDATKASLDGSDPPLPAVFPQPYGHNMLLISNKSAAALDTPHPDYVLAIQNVLNAGESWTMIVPVVGLVAFLDEADTKETYQSVCEKADQQDTWAVNTQSLYNWWKFIFATQMYLSDQSSQYIGLAPEHPAMNCEQLQPYVDHYKVDRRRCVATWSVSREGIHLVRGSCDTTALSGAQQENVRLAYLALDRFYMPSLIETLYEFTASNTTFHRGDESVWKAPYLATSVAAMLWSRMGALQPALDPETFNSTSRAMSVNGTTLTHEEVEDVYIIRQDGQTILYNRPTLRKSPWLYLVLAAQPVLTLIFLGVISVLYLTPVGEGFNLISVLSGVDHRNLGSLAGASLSGKLIRPVKLVMNPTKSDGLDRVTSRVVTSSEDVGSGKLTLNVVYH